jgi:ribosomal protein L11 methyltransferase
MNDFVLGIACDPKREEEITARLFLTRTTGCTTDEHDGRSIITAYLESTEARDEAASWFDDVDVTAGERERQDWLQMYQQMLRPIFIGQSFVVAPDAALIPADAGRHALVIPQEQAFGTGSHETTSLCIELLETLDLAGARGLDIGAGSGILALAMLRLGAGKAIAFDNDADACAALRDNRVRNGVAPSRMPLFIGSIESLRGGQFDVITMNIVPEVILPLLPRVASALTPALSRNAGEGGAERRVRVRGAGSLILSGILIARRDEIVAACPLALVAEREKGEWWAGRFRCA